MTSSRRPSRLLRWHEIALYFCGFCLLASGIIWLVLDSWVRVSGDFGPGRHPAEHWAIIIHGTMAYIFLIFAGMLIHMHIVPGWRFGLNRVSGALMAGSCLFLSFTALMLYYTGNEALRDYVSLLHWTVGVGAAILLICHVLIGRREAKRRL